MRMNNKLFVGNLSYSTTEDDLRELFTEAGTIDSVDLIKDRNTGQSKGFAFVEMSSRDEAQTAIDMFNGKALNERALTVNIAKPRKERRDFGNRGGGRRRR
jgi:RNA recognition motif-containing protein